MRKAGIEYAARQINDLAETGDALCAYLYDES